MRLLPIALLAAFALPCLAQFTPAPAGPAPAGGGPSSVVAADFNNDGLLDFATADPATGTITVMLQTPLGSFTPTTGLPTLSLVEPVALAVFYIQGCAAASCASLAVVDQSKGQVIVLLGDGTGNFTTPYSPYPVGTSPVFVAAGNFNNSPAVAVADFGGAHVYLLSGSASGDFSCSNQFTVGNDPSSVAIGDFNGDGVPDLAVANKRDSTVTVLLLKPNPSPGCGYSQMNTGAKPVNVAPVTPPVPPTAYPTSIVTADFNLDGKLDLAVANEGLNSLTILLGDGTGNFNPSQYNPALPAVPTGNEPFSLAAGYFNDDPYPDLAVVNLADSTVSVFTGNGAGGFTGATGSPYGVGYQPESVAVGDFNNDGRADLAVASRNSNTVNILLNGYPSPTTVSYASFKPPVAPGSLINITGSSLATAAPPPSSATSLPFTLGGAAVILTDSTGLQTPLALMSTSPTQIVAMIPQSVNAPPAYSPVNPPPALVSIYAGTAIQTGIVPLQAVAPALFSADGTGAGSALGSYSGNPGGNIADCPAAANPASCVPIPITLSAGVTLTIYGTGIDVQPPSTNPPPHPPTVTVNFGATQISCMVNPTAAELSALMAGQCAVSPGAPQSLQLASMAIDQYTIVPPTSAAMMSGIVAISVTSGTLTSNVVTVFAVRVQTPPIAN